MGDGLGGGIGGSEWWLCKILEKISNPILNKYIIIFRGGSMTSKTIN